jgi:hypothetical protein
VISSEDRCLRVEVSEDRLESSGFCSRDEIGLIDHDHVGTLHLIDEELHDVSGVVLIEPDAGGPIREFSISALSNDGDAVDDVTLNNAHVAGKVRFISYMYDFYNLPVGYTMPMGIRINETTLWNGSGIENIIEATRW